MISIGRAAGILMAQIGLLLLTSSVAAHSTAASRNTAASDLTGWQRAQSDDTPQAYQAYLAQFPTGVFNEIARSRTSGPLLNDMLPLPPAADNAAVQVEVAAIRSAWDNAAWARVKAANTHAAYREYLLHLPVGEHSNEAVLAYQNSLPSAPQPRVAQCVEPDKEAKITQRIDIRNSYPAYAIERWTDGIVIGKNHVDYSGKALGMTILYASNLDMFGPAARTSAAKARYAPAVQNCAQIGSVTSLVFAYLTGDLPYESRENAEGPPLNVALNTEIRGSLGADRAQLFSFTPSSGISVYEIDVTARFPHMMSKVDDSATSVRAFRGNIPLTSNKMFVTSSNEPVLLRISAPDKPNSKRKNMGNYRLTIRQVFNEPQPINSPPNDSSPR